MAAVCSRGRSGLDDAEAVVLENRRQLQRHPRRSGLTNNDTGARADPAGNGRGRRRSGLTDNDTGARADPAGNGRGRRSCSDSDSGGSADPIGCGRRC